MDKIYLIYFSATANTRTILKKIAEGTGINDITEIDITPPKSRIDADINIEQNALVLFGAPVYMGRVQKDALSFIAKIKGQGQNAVAVVTYGNRAYEDALLELSDTLATNNFDVLAAAAFIGQHSFTDKTIEIAAGRPDKDDLDAALKFGKDIIEKISSGKKEKIQVPGNSPYKKLQTMPKMAPVKTNKCINCGTCAAICPVGAIDNNAVGDKNKCIVCFACIKYCPNDSREMRNMLLKVARKRLTKGPKKQPELFI